MNPSASTGSSVRILGFSDTYGEQSGNGVGRFLHDLHERSQRDQASLRLIVPGKDESKAGITSVRAPSFVVPGYSKLSIAMPLEHQRKQIERQFRSDPADCIHVSTPGPFGGVGLMLANRYRVPLLGIYHTDFPSYARQITRQVIDRFISQPQSFGKLTQHFAPMLFKWGMVAQQANPDFYQDLGNVTEVVQRNWRLIEAHRRGSQALVDAAEYLMKQAVKKFYSEFTFVIARSTQQQSQLQQMLELPEDRIKCLRPGTDTERFHPRYENRSVWNDWGIPSDAFIALYVGRITAEKNIDWLLKIWDEYLPQAPRESHLVILGHGETEDVERASNRKTVHVLGSFTGETLSTLYASSDCLIFPSITETLGQVGLEAGASGLPVLVSNRGGQQMYVDNGTTGYICDATDSARWVEKLNALCQCDDTRRRIGKQARDHIASNFSMDHSIASYWQLHEEAIQVHRDRQRKRARSIRSKAVPMGLQSKVPSKGVMFISDYHAGRRFGSETQRRFKQNSMERMLTTAMEQDLDVVLGGDFGDHGARATRLQADFASFRSIRDRVGFNGSPIFLRGNHDYGFSDEQLNELLGGCQIHHSLVYYHQDSRVTMTHGHILALAKTMDVIESVVDRNELIARLTEEKLDEDLKPSVIAYDLANLVETSMAQYGLTGLTALWESMYSSRAELAEHLLRFGRTSDHADEATWKMIAGLVGTHDNAEVAARLGDRCDGWASLFGHTHEPLATRKRMPATDGSTRVQIVGNSGHINTKQPTCAVARFPEVTVFRYSGKRDALKPLKRATLSTDEVEGWARRESTASQPSIKPSDVNGSALTSVVSR